METKSKNMETIRNTITELINETLIQAILSNAKNPDKASKVKLRPVRLKDELYIQETLQRLWIVFVRIWSRISSRR